MGRKQPIDIPRFYGINKLHTRNPGELSGGKNFITAHGELITRDGAVLVPSSFTSPPKSLHTASKVGMTTRLLVEEGTNLHHNVDGVWSNIKADCTLEQSFSSTKWNDYLIIVNGEQMLAYDVTNGTISALTDSAGGTVPNMKYVTTFKGFIFGWSPDHADSNYIWFSGYEKDADGFILGKSKDAWPADYFLDIGGSAETPVIDAIPFDTHLYVLTQKGNWRVYGYSEDNFEVTPGGNTGVYAEKCSALVGDYIMWVGYDKKVYYYTGTNALSLSGPIDELLMDEDFSNVFAFEYTNQFWVAFPKATTTTFYVFDTIEKQWFILEFPFVVTSQTSFSEYLGETYLHFGLNDNRIVKMDDVSTDLGTTITTELVIGPMNIESRKFKVKTLWITSEPRNDFTLNITPIVDNEPDHDTISVPITVGNITSTRVRMQGVKGQDIALKITTTDKINGIQKATLSIIPKDVK